MQQIVLTIPGLAENSQMLSNFLSNLSRQLLSQGALLYEVGLLITLAIFIVAKVFLSKKNENDRC